MLEKPEFETVSEELVKVFIQFRRLRMELNNAKFDPNREHCQMKHSEIMVLYELNEEGCHFPEGVSVSTVSRHLRVKPPSITPIINSLERKHLIERTIDPNDRRIIRIHLTEAGSAFIEHNKQMMIQEINGLVEYLGKDKSTELARLITESLTYYNDKMKKEHHS